MIASVMGIILLEIHGLAFDEINRKLQAFSKFSYPSLSETIIRKYYIWEHMRTPCGGELILLCHGGYLSTLYQFPFTCLIMLIFLTLIQLPTVVTRWILPSGGASRSPLNM